MVMGTHTGAMDTHTWDTRVRTQVDFKSVIVGAVIVVAVIVSAAVPWIVITDDRRWVG